MLEKFTAVTKIMLESLEESSLVIVFKKEAKKVSIAEEQLKLALKRVCIIEFEFLFILLENNFLNVVDLSL